MSDSISEFIANSVARVFSLAPSPSNRPGERITYDALESQTTERDAYKCAVKWLKIADKGGPNAATNARFALKQVGRLAFDDEATALGLLILAKNSPNATLSQGATEEHSRLIAESQPATADISEVPRPAAKAKDRYAPIVLRQPIGGKPR